MKNLRLRTLAAIFVALFAGEPRRRAVANTAQTDALVTRVANGMKVFIPTSAVTKSYEAVRQTTVSAVDTPNGTGVPLGIIQDDAGAAGTEGKTVAIYGVAPGTQKARVTGDVAINDKIYTANTGNHTASAPAAGQGYHVGWALTAATAASGEDLIEMRTCSPVVTV